MSLTITFLGTGGAFTDFRVNYHNNALISTEEGPVLIDCGGTAPQALRELGLRCSDVAAVILTHLHGDHVGGLEQLVWERTYGVPGGAVPIPLWADPSVLSGARSVVEPQIGLYTCPARGLRDDGWAALIAHRSVRGGHGCADDGAEPFTIGGVQFSLHATPHVSSDVAGKPCFGVRVRKGDAELYFTSDTEFRSDIGDRFSRAQALFHDTTFQPRFPGTVHTHYEELLNLPPAVRRRVVLMHFTEVPPGISVQGDGFAGAAQRLQSWRVAPQGAPAPVVIDRSALLGRRGSS